MHCASLKAQLRKLAMTASSAPALTADYSVREEFASSLIHGIGIVLGTIGLVILVLATARGHDVLHMASVCIYGVTLIALYLASTLYHGIAHPPAKPLLRVLDHSAIFLLIAGTYTPFTLLVLPPAWGWSLCIAIWMLAIAGSVMELKHPRHGRKLAAALYVAMGWVGLIAIVPLQANLATPGLLLLLAGGAAYTLGVPFYLLKRLRWHHAIWHVFVLAGSVLHYFAVLLYVLPHAH